MADAEDDLPHEGRTTTVTAALADDVRAALAAGQPERLQTLVASLPAADLADLIAMLEPEGRVALVGLLGVNLDVDVFAELDSSVRDQLAEALPNELLARFAAHLETDDAAYLIEGLEAADRAEVLARLPFGERTALERNLDYPEETAGRLMQAAYVAVPPFWSVGQVIDHLRVAKDLPESFIDLFVVDPGYRVLGSLDPSRLLRAPRRETVEHLMRTDRRQVLATADQEDVARQFERYNLMSAPVVDETGRLVGVITVDDVVDVIQEEAEEDIRALAGVGDERLTDSVIRVAPPRFWWLAVNLATAILASSVIKVFDSTIANMVALAVLMPIVASMGGNAGTQTMTIAVRALALRQLTPLAVAQFALRETAVGLVNGVAFAVIMGAIAWWWFGTAPLGLVIGAAMIINLLAAAVAGILIPLGLDRLGFDPAVSSTVFVTTVTDVVGFFAFLGLAALWLK
jgi:magnesium transporter